LATVVFAGAEPAFAGIASDVSMSTRTNAKTVCLCVFVMIV